VVTFLVGGNDVELTWGDWKAAEAEWIREHPAPEGWGYRVSLVAGSSGPEPGPVGMCRSVTPAEIATRAQNCWAVRSFADLPLEARQR
jgi:hypothetical protein